MNRLWTLFTIFFLMGSLQAKALLSENLGQADAEIFFNMLETMVESKIQLTPFSYQETRTFETGAKEFSIRCKANKLAEFGYQDHACTISYSKNPAQISGVELVDGPLAHAKIIQINSIKEGTKLYNRVLKRDNEYRSTEKVPFRLLNGSYTSFPFASVDCEEVSLTHPNLARCQVTIVPRVE